MSARRPWAWPLVPLYRAGLAAQAALRRPPQQLAWPVVSVGSLSAGGAGKTPVVIALAQLLAHSGYAVDVLSRGYGRTGRSVERVLESDAAGFGDEPVLIAQRTGVPVWVGADRYAAGRAAELPTQQDHGSQPNLRVHLLDDGFQHRALARAVDVVLVTAEDLAEPLLPAGNLREPLAALARADVVVVREDELAPVRDLIWPLLREGAQLWVVRRTLRFPGLGSSAECDGLQVFGAGLQPLAFCGLARPQGFAQSLQASGCGIVDTLAFPDHARYDDRALQQILTTARQLHATGLVTTEKDAVKLSSAARTRLAAAGPLLVAALDAEFVDGPAVLASLQARLQPAHPEAPQRAGAAQ